MPEFTSGQREERALRLELLLRRADIARHLAGINAGVLAPFNKHLPVYHSTLDPLGERLFARWLPKKNLFEPRDDLGIKLEEPCNGSLYLFAAHRIDDKLGFVGISEKL